jgi:uncharacterized protein with ATP-grasp and redox domains
MYIALECIPCIVNNYIKLTRDGTLPEDAIEKNLRRFLVFLSKADYKQSPPVLGREVHRMIRRMLKNNDPYSGIKQKYNGMILNMYGVFENMIKKSHDPFDTALKLAIAGNVIDFGCQHRLDIMHTVQKVLHADINNHHSTQLRNNLERAEQVLYIGDNCGEIVFDKLFIKTINHPNIYFAVRGGAVINDVTEVDADMVDIGSYAKVITTGDDAPGAVWKTSSEEFKTIFKHSDVVIAKGQGNLEGLIDVNHNIYFLFVVKCNLIASRVGANIGDFIIKNSRVIHDNEKGKAK